MAKDKVTSSFVLEKADITADELWKLMMYCAHPSNLNGERWEFDMTTAYGHCWLNGRAEGEDTGKFWDFLVLNKMDNKIDIVRG